jgi:hypothetical protein
VLVTATRSAGAEAASRPSQYRLQMTALTAAEKEEAADAAGPWVVPPDVDVRVVAAGEGVAGEGAAWAAWTGRAALITRAAAAAVIVLDRLYMGPPLVTSLSVEIDAH